MAEVPRSRIAKWLDCRRGTFRPKSAALLLVLGSSLLISSVAVAAQSTPSQQGKKPAQANPNPPAAEPVIPPQAQIWLPPLQAAEHAPTVDWDGKNLTIDADNSSLADILTGIGARTGADIEMPPSTRTERIAVHLGPAPMRDVLSALLYGTDFNYVIQSSDDDGALGKVILTSRDGDQSDDVLAGDSHTNPKVRLMPGYGAPGRRHFEMGHSRAMQNSSSSADETPAAETPAADPTPVGVATDSTGASPAVEAQPGASIAEANDSAAPSDSTTLTATDQAGSANAAGSGSDSDSSNGGGAPTISQMEQNLQHMYQQRQQLQAQQTRGNQTTAP